MLESVSWVEKVSQFGDKEGEVGPLSSASASVPNFCVELSGVSTKALLIKLPPPPSVPSLEGSSPSMLINCSHYYIRFIPSNKGSFGVGRWDVGRSNAMGRKM